MHESLVRKVVKSPLGLSVRISLRIQITLRCSLRWGAGHRAVNVRLTWRWLSLLRVDPLVDRLLANGVE